MDTAATIETQRATLNDHWDILSLLTGDEMATRDQLDAVMAINPDDQFKYSEPLDSMGNVVGFCYNIGVRCR